MDKNLLREIKRFINDNYKKIFIMGIVISIFYTTVSIVGAYFDQKGQEESVHLNKELEETEVAEPGVFRFYVELPDGNSYPNITIFEEYFLLPEKVAQAERVTRVEISDLLEEEKLNEFEKTMENRGVLGVSRNQSSGIYTFKANLGNAKANLAVATFYFEYLLEESIPILEDKSLFVVEEPYLAALTEEEALELSQPQRMNTIGSFIKKIAINLVIGLLAGFVIAAFIYIFLSLINKKISYSFTYNWEMEDYHLIVDSSKESWKDALSLVMYPSIGNKVLLTDSNEVRTKIISALSDYESINMIDANEDRVDGKLNLVVAKNIHDISPTFHIDEIIYVLESHESEKQWYYDQRALTNHYPIRNKVIQVNS